MKKIILGSFLFVIICSLGGCSVDTKRGTEVSKDDNRIFFLNDFSEKYDVFLKKEDKIYLNSELLAISSLKPDFLTTKSYLISVNNKKNYTIASEGSTGSINSKILNINGKKFESKIYGFVDNYLFSEKNIAYYKCEKLIYFSDTNLNDCLANQIWLDDMLVDSIDMDFLYNNRKYPFYLKWLDNEKLIYQKGDNFYIIKIGENKPTLYTELNNLKQKYKDNEDDYGSFNFIGMVGMKIVYSLENYGNIYDDILMEKINSILLKNTPGFKSSDSYELKMLKKQIKFPYYGKNSDGDSINPNDYDYTDGNDPYIPTISGMKHLKNATPDKISDLYIDGEKYDTNVVGYKIINNDVYTVKFTNVKFEQANLEYFDTPDKTFLQTMMGDVSKIHIIYSLYKNKQFINKVEYKSIYEYGANGNIKIINSEEEPCIFDEAINYTDNVTICISKGSQVIQTSVAINEGEKDVNKKVLLYNGIKLNTYNALYETLQKINEGITDEKTRLENFKKITKETISDIEIIPEKFQPIFDSNGSLIKIFLFGRVNDDSVGEMFNMLSLKQEERNNYIGTRLGMKDGSILEKVDKEGEGKLSDEEKKQWKKAEKYMNDIFEGKKGLFEAEYQNNGNFSKPEKQVVNINEFYGVIKK